jgi:peptidyl-prolyl cis-trans isomerase B (cyclophilin B)|tara:strand:+ start:295 stop:1023 length:729 start_codon:yes stop_codon:yes gene_type:complete
MRLIRNIALFCIVTMLFGCSGLRKNDKNIIESIVKVTTSMGDMYIQLSDKAPKHKANFIKLAKEGFYDSLLFHRVINGFMIQGGDPESRNASTGSALGNGGPGYTVPAIFDTTLYHQKGALAAARQPDNVNPKKASSGSQFYIAQGKVYSKKEIMNLEKGMQRKYPNFKFTKTQIEAYTTLGGTPFLDQNYTVYGQVIKGIEAIDKIAKASVDKRNRPKKDLIIQMEVLQLNAKEKAKLLEK